VKAFYKEEEFLFTAKWLKKQQSRFLLHAMHNVWSHDCQCFDNSCLYLSNELASKDQI